MPPKKSSPSEPPTISVVIPTMNQGEYLEQCLRSVVDQQYPRTQLIVIDGGSTDSTVKILKAFERYIHYWTTESDRGQSHALNKGFAEATGEVFCWQNSDDYYTEGAFWSVADAFKRHPEAPLVYGDWIEVDASGQLLVQWHAFPFSDRSARYGGSNAIAQAMFWRRDVHARFGEFPENLHQVMDHYLTFRIGLNEGFNRFLQIEKTLTAFRRHEEQKTGNLSNSTVSIELAEMDAQLGIRRKGGVVGGALRLSYRFLRTYRYWRRGGLRYVAARIRQVRPDRA